jgi:hypothetical protein
MKVIAAYLLAALGGNTTPSAEDIKSILESGYKHKLHNLPLQYILKMFKSAIDII